MFTAAAVALLAVVVYAAIAIAGRDSVPVANTPLPTTSSTADPGPTTTIVPTLSAGNVAVRLLGIWRGPIPADRRRAYALEIATPEAVDVMFAVPRPGRPTKDTYIPPPRARGCHTRVDQSVECVFFYRGGVLTLVAVGSSVDGYRIQSVAFEPGEEFEPYPYP